MAVYAEADRSERLRRASLAGGLTGVVVGILIARHFLPYLIDQAYIAFRYAGRIAAGVGPVFNTDGVPKEGFSSPLWTALFAGIAKVSSPDALPGASIALGILAFAGCAMVLARAGRVEPERSMSGALIGRLLPAGLWCLSSGALFGAATGTELIPFAFFALLAHASIEKRAVLAAGIASAFLAMWMRPEAGLLVAAVAAQIIVSEPGRTFRRALPVVAAALLGWALLEAARHHVFHQWWPEMLRQHHPSLAEGVASLKHLSLSATALLLAGLAGAAFGEPRHRGWLAAGAVWLTAAFVSWGEKLPGDLIVEPALVLFALAAGGLGRTFDQVAGTARVWPFFGGLAILIGIDLAGTAARIWSFETEDAPDRLAQKSITRWLKPSIVSTGAAAEVGRLAYICDDDRFYDFDGIQDFSGLQYVQSPRHPQVVVIRLLRLSRDASGRAAPKPEDAASESERQILGSAAFQAMYSLMSVQPPASASGMARALYVTRNMGLYPYGTKSVYPWMVAAPPELPPDADAKLGP